MALDPKINDLWRRFTTKFPLVPGEENCRQHMIRFAEQVNFTYPNEGYGVKSASSSRPKSKDSTAKISPVNGSGYNHNSLFSWDMISGAGTNNPVPLYANQREWDIHNPPEGPQYFHPVGAVDHLQEGQVPNPPNPEPDPDKIKLIEVRSDLQEIVRDITDYLS